MHKCNAMWLFAVLLIYGFGSSVFAQTGEDSRIYIRSVADNPAHSQFLRENFSREANEAGYTVTDNISNASYILTLEVVPNTVRQGVEPAQPNEKQFRLRLNMERSSDNLELVGFSFQFTELDEINSNVPDLLHDVMVNVPLPRPDSGQVAEIVRVEVPVVRDVEIIKLEEVEVVRQVLVQEPDSWRNKLLYLRISADAPVNYYQVVRPGGLLNGTHIYNDNPPRQSRLDDQIIMVPGATVGLELQFLNWMSAALNFEMRFADVSDYTFIPGVGLQLKLPIIKPARHFMLEPYVAGSYAMNLAAHSVSFPAFAVGGGMQFCVKGGNSGAWFFDVNYMHSLDEVRAKNIVKDFPEPKELRWNRFVVGLGIGYKVGFIDRGR